MMNFKTTTSLTFSALLLISCAQISRKPHPQSDPVLTQAPVADLSSDTVEIEGNELEIKKGAENHELADAQASDSDIKAEQGVAEIDSELPGSEKDEVPYEREFLTKKKTKRMQYWVDYFTKKDIARFQRFVNNGEEYRAHIEKIFMEHGLPKELYFVGLIESGYYLGARSHAAAVGPWQFIRGTGRRYGLKMSNEIDERQDLFKATRAAARYFKDMHNVFSSWELALAGYNAGEFGIIRRIMKHGTRDFYQLSKNKQLPEETINYVPKVLAAMHIVNNAEKYGIILPKKTHRLFDKTQLKVVPKGTSLSHIANQLGVSQALLKRLNPELRRHATPRRYAGNYYLRVPGSKYTEDFSPEKVVVAELKRPERRIELARRIARAPAAPKHLKVSRTPITYKVRRGENLTVLARVFDVKLTQLKKVNRLKRSTIMAGQKIVLPGHKGVYVVRRGDNMTKVARKLNSSVEALVKLNALKRKTVYAGQKIIVNVD